MEVKLIVQNARTSLREVTLRRPRTVIGRKKGCKIRIRTGGVSRIHCVLLRREKELFVKDLGSTNGTFVNGQLVNMTALHAGDMLGVGPLVFMVQIDGQPPVADVAEIVSDDAAAKEEVIFETADENEDAAEEFQVIEQADQFIEVSEADAIVDLTSLSDSAHPASADDAVNFQLDEDAPAAEPSMFPVVDHDDVPGKRPKRR